MTNLEKATKVAKLREIILDMQENKKRIKALNLFRTTFFVEVGGGAVHLRFHPNDTDINNGITHYFIGLFDNLETAAAEELDGLLVK